MLISVGPRPGGNTTIPAPTGFPAPTDFPAKRYPGLA
ncbi:hypothetical protein TIFTF001_017554 [Ficus carica]|uniref:Uncharacterized protein n=1 Tax=Ficus carica TaxID=3494 RepID=A0AA88ALC9_FICCA|nr:hypothetical protein TIFTF001_017554 [Ficus carica]